MYPALKFAKVTPNCRFSSPNLRDNRVVYLLSWLQNQDSSPAVKIMIIQLTNYLKSWQRKLLAFCLVLSLASLVFIRLLVNPHFVTNYILDSNIQNETAICIFAPSMCIYQAILRFAPHAAKWQVLTVLGQPRYREVNLKFAGCSSDMDLSDQVWFYEVAPHIMVMLGFKDDCCVFAKSLNVEEERAYEQWKTAQIREFAIGLTEEQIESRLGCCFVKNPEFVCLVLNVLGYKCGEPTLWKDIPGNFYFSPGSVVQLEMCHGRCVRADLLGIFH